MKIIYFGTPEIAVETLMSLYHEKDIEILAVVTQVDKEVGRKKILTATPVKIAAEQLNLKVLEAKNKAELEEVLEEFDVDFFVVFAFGMILTKRALNMPQIAPINIHASLLPKYRGASPIQESLKNGENQTGISIMKMGEELDSGDIYTTKTIDIDENDTYISLSEKISNLSATTLPEILREIESKELILTPQDNEKAIYCKKIHKEDGEINFNKSAKEIQNTLRAYTPWPLIWTKYKNKKIKIIKTEIADRNIEPGKFIIENNTLLIGTKEGSLKPQILQVEGKKEMNIKSFLNGYQNLFLD